MHAPLQRPRHIIQTGETRALNAELEELVKQIIDVNDGVE